MATIELYLEDSYLKQCSANIVSMQDRFVIMFTKLNTILFATW